VIEIELHRGHLADDLVLQVTVLNGGNLHVDEYNDEPVTARVEDATLVVRDLGGLVLAIYRGPWKAQIAPRRSGTMRTG